MNRLVEDRTAEYRQRDREWEARTRIYREMVRAGWDPRKEDEFSKEAKRRLIKMFPYLEGPPGSKPAQKRNKTMEEGSYNQVPTRMPTGRHSMMIQDYGYM